jgi:hypothetical protein
MPARARQTAGFFPSAAPCGEAQIAHAGLSAVAQYRFFDSALGWVVHLGGALHAQFF